MRILGCLLLLIVLGGCVIQPRTSLSCNFKRYELSVSDPFSSESKENKSGPTRRGDTLADAIRNASFPTSKSDNGVDPSMLFLSGGSQHGAFGAGYLDEWRAHRTGARLPDFAVVTGISTGAIISTFAFVNRTPTAVDGYTITNEHELLKPIATFRKGEPTTWSYVRLLRQGALADLAPLRQMLIRLFDEDVLLDVARQADRGRLLVVGVVDVDTGDGVALDLTEMAKRYRAAAAGPARDAARACYAEAVIASSSAPMAALPVFIDNRMYVDGGARFGMFSDELGAVMDKTSNERAALGPNGPTIYLIANGDQEVGPSCGRADASLCKRGFDPPEDLQHPHRNWKFTALALRSEGILTNQVYRFSADSIRIQAAERKFRLVTAKIEKDMPGHDFTLADPVLGNGKDSCAGWHEIDRSKLNPIQFYPRYMRCLIDYGRERARKDLSSGLLQ